jgi:hypothetical protein
MKMQDGRAGHSEVRNAVITWLAKQAPGEEFFYSEVASELGYQQTSVSAVMNSLMRAVHPVLSPGSRRGWYKVTGEVNGKVSPPPAIAQAQAAAVIDAGRPASLPLPPRDVELMEVLGLLRDGSKLLRDENGDLWKAVAQ